MNLQSFISSLNVYSVIATILSMVGQIGVTKQKTWGLVVWIASNFVWIYVDIVVHPDYPQVVQYFYYMVMNTITIFVWRKLGKLSSKTVSDGTNDKAVL